MFPKIVGTPKSSNLIGISIINRPFWGTPIFGNTYMIPLFFVSIIPSTKQPRYVALFRWVPSWREPKPPQKKEIGNENPGLEKDES